MRYLFIQQERQGKMKHPLSYGHSVTSQWIYGPVYSRRYGHSLGINLLPKDNKYCSFNCIYCQLGWSDSQIPKMDEFPSVEALSESFHLALLESPSLDAITISGNGEPTLHPQFEAMTSALRRILEENSLTTPLVCFTNGTTLHQKHIQQALSTLDEVSVKWDANPKKTNLYKKKIRDKDLPQLLSCLDNITLQSCFYKGVASNSDEKSTQAWIQSLHNLKAGRIDIYTLSRVTAAKDLLPLSKEELEAIAHQLKIATPIQVRVIV